MPPLTIAVGFDSLIGDCNADSGAAFIIDCSP